MQVLGDLSLVISDVQLEDTQQYVCEASNALGSDIDPALLTVLGKPGLGYNYSVCSNNVDGTCCESISTLTLHRSLQRRVTHHTN